MYGRGEQIDSQFVPQLPGEPEGAKGHGVVFFGNSHVRYVEVDPRSPLLPRYRSIGRLDETTVAVSSEWDTRPVSDRHGFRPTQSDIVRKYIAEEQVLIKLVQAQ